CGPPRPPPPPPPPPPAPLAPIGSVEELTAHHELSPAEVLYNACLESDIKLIEELVRDGANYSCFVPHPDNADSEERMGDIPILAYACMIGSTSLVQLLLEKGAEPAYWMLREAFDHGKDSIVALLMSKGVSIDTLTKDGGSLLHMACFYQRAEEVERLIKLGANVNHCDINGEPPLILSFEHRDATPAKTREIMQKLLDAGADKEIRWGGDTPLIAAARANNLTAFSLLLEKGADANVKSSEGLTLLQITSAPKISKAIRNRLRAHMGLEL